MAARNLGVATWSHHSQGHIEVTGRVIRERKSRSVYRLALRVGLTHLPIEWSSENPYPCRINMQSFQGFPKPDLEYPLVLHGRKAAHDRIRGRLLTKIPIPFLPFSMQFWHHINTTSCKYCSCKIYHVELPWFRSARRIFYFRRVRRRLLQNSAE